MRIAFLTTLLPPDAGGGAEIQSLRLCSKLSEKNNVTVFSRRISRKSIKVIDNYSFSLKSRFTIRIPIIRPIFDLFYSIIIIGLNKNNYDIFICYKIQTPAIALMVAKFLFKIKYIVSPRGEVDYFNKNTFSKILFRSIYNNSTNILIQTELIKNKFLLELEKEYGFSKISMESINDKIIIFPNGIEKNNNIEKRSINKVIKLVYAGRLVRDKGVEYIIKSLSKIHSNVQLLIIGNGDDYRRLKIMSFNLPVEFYGEVPFNEVLSFIAKGDIFIFPSLSESMPNVVIEALSMGIPCICTNVGAIPEIIEDNYNGFLVSKKSSSNIADSVEKILSNEELYSNMRYNAIESVKKYYWNNIMPDLQLKFEKIIA